jgi:hypothetical protein
MMKEKGRVVKELVRMGKGDDKREKTHRGHGFWLEGHRDFE